MGMRAPEGSKQRGKGSKPNMGGMGGLFKTQGWACTNAQGPAYAGRNWRGTPRVRGRRICGAIHKSWHHSRALARQLLSLGHCLLLDRVR